ncbi:hypothetical protein ODJ79_26895 [Actinoplanes sp. KI2]|uniref:hypothetical protein n=1 Tax=Actinoplanes sp. KI2 TaxID=2983315 RepID=UPI0021D60F22|nr:hypothetical protein [Actinoplanes sp. KI2]MCU7727375.1 hypothetical protein [Actinoplanes sp. KI2]
MFRLIQLHSENGVPRIGVESDGYVSARTALAHYRSRPAAYFGVGRFDHEGTLAEIILDRLCGPLGDCPRPASVVHARSYQRLCATCSLGLEVLTVPELARMLGIACRLAPMLARSGRHARLEMASPSGNRIAREFATHVHDPIWRREVCAELAADPSSVNGLLIGVGALTHRDVLDLYPRLRSLADELPGSVRDELTRATARPLSPAGVAGLRMGLSFQP